MKLTHASLFSGIGGFDLAAEWAGWHNMFQCELNEFGQKILKHYWPCAVHYGDITQTDFTIWRGRIDVLTGGFPCQPYSVAGKRKGKEDERHLWPQMLRAIREIQPRYVVGENVNGLVNWNGGLVFDEVQSDLEAEGYEVQPVILPASSVNAPHRRDRVWFVAYSDHARADRAMRSEPYGPQNYKGRGNQPFAEFRQDDVDGNVTDTYQCTAGPSRASNGAGRNGSRNNDEQEKWRQSAKQHTRCSNVLRNVADTARQQSERLQPEQREFSNQEQRQFGRNSGGMGDGVTTDPGCGQWKNRVHGEEQGRETAEFGDSYTKFGRFEKFPITEPTICSGNDGISSELDGITFPKWRNESIKAFGNAIVPHVAYEIFKVINIHANDNNS